MRYGLWLAGLLACSHLAPAHALQAGQTVQQQFEAASTALGEERWNDALQRFEALEAQLERGTSRRNLAIVRVRKASALLRLRRRDEAAAALRLGLPELPASDASLNEDRFLGLQTLGELAELALDYAEARRHYRAAAEIAVPPMLKLTLYRGLVQTQMFEDGPAALASADEGLALALSLELGEGSEGLLRTFRGRVLLNMGRYAEAHAELRAAMQRLGGLSRRVDIADIVSRHDLAIAALLAGDEDDARRYLAYTGAGRFETELSPSRGRLIPPRCGNGLAPTDVAVIEYSINDDGTVGRATPIYASRSGASALQFARAVLDWGWDPESFGEMPPLLRSAMRVELRCVHPAVDEPSDADAEEARQWIAERGEDWPEDDRARLRPLASVRADVAREEVSAANSTRLLCLLWELARHPGVGHAETAGYLRRALTIATAQQAPPALVTALARSLVLAEHFAAGRSAYDRAPDYSTVLDLPVVRDDPRTLAALRLAQATGHYYVEEDEDAARFADLALSTPGLTDGDSARIGALQLKALIAAGRDDMDAARTTFSQAGPSADACDYLPRVRNTPGRASDFPREAQQWGFEGWARVETFVMNDGTSSRPRTVMSYPPFVFDEAAENVTGRRRFEAYYHPDPAGCPTQTNVMFRLPRP